MAEYITKDGEVFVACDYCATLYPSGARDRRGLAADMRLGGWLFVSDPDGVEYVFCSWECALAAGAPTLVRRDETDGGKQ